MSSGAAAGELTRSVEALSDLLVDSTAKNLALAHKLIAVAAETAVRGFEDPLLGNRVDLEA